MILAGRVAATNFAFKFPSMKERRERRKKQKWWVSRIHKNIIVIVEERMLRGSEKGGFLHKRYKLKFYGTFFTTRLPFKELLLNNFMIFHKISSPKSWIKNSWWLSRGILMVTCCKKSHAKVLHCHRRFFHSHWCCCHSKCISHSIISHEVAFTRRLWQIRLVRVLFP